jgi:hypothetical protein
MSERWFVELYEEENDKYAFKGMMFESSAIPSFFEIKEAGGVCALSEKNRIVGF